MEGFVHPDFGVVTEKVRYLMSKDLAVKRAAMAVACIPPRRVGRGRLDRLPECGGRSVGARHDVDEFLHHQGCRRDDRAPARRSGTARLRRTGGNVLAPKVPRPRGEDAITLRHLLTHQAALHDVRVLVDSTEGLLDWDNMVKLLAEATPAWEVGTRRAGSTHLRLAGRRGHPPGHRPHGERGAATARSSNHSASAGCTSARRRRRFVATSPSSSWIPKR